MLKTQVMTEETNPDLLPEGLSDRIAPEGEAAAMLDQAMLGTLLAHGYDLVAPPLVEYERSLLARMPVTDRHEMLRFVDPVSLRTMALRSDVTVQVGRIATTRLAAQPRPLRLCYAGPVLRLKAGQLHPEREQRQIGAELIGRDTVAAAREMVGVAIAALRAVGVKGIGVDFTLPDLVDTLAKEAMPLPEGALDAVRRELDMKDAGALKALGAGAYLPLLTATGPFHAAMDALAAIDAGGVLASRIAGLRAIAEPIDWDVRLTLDPTERHGFEYQSWFGFTLYAEGLNRELGRGGTYAIRRPDGSEEVATGFSLYPDALVAAGFGRGDAKRVYLPVGTSLEDAERLRAEGWRTIGALGDDEDPVALGCSHVWRGGEAVEF